MSDENESKVVELRTRADTSPKKLAGSVVKNHAEGRKVKITAIGAGAVNQAVKGLAIARTMLLTQGEENVYVIPAWSDLEVEGEKKSGLVFILVVK